MAFLRLSVNNRHLLNSAELYVPNIVSFKRYEASTAINLANLKRGKGARSSFSGNVVTVFGATSAVGRGVVTKLAKIGCQVIIPYRADAYDVESLKLCGDLGQILFTPYHLNDEISIAKSLRYSTMAVNLVSAQWSTKNFTMGDVNVDGAARIARIAKDCGVHTLFHMSSMNVSYNPPSFFTGGSEFLRTKAYGEDAVREAFPEAIIFRPTDIYGGGNDRFMRYYASFSRRAYNPFSIRRRIPMWKLGVRTTKMPVFLQDVTQGISNALRRPEARGKTYDIHGPHRYRLDDLLEYMYAMLRNPNVILTPITPMFVSKIALLQIIHQSRKRVWLDKLEREFLSDTPTGLPTLADLGVTSLANVEDKFDYELRDKRRGNFYWETFGEFIEPERPQHLETPPFRGIEYILTRAEPGRDPSYGFTVPHPKLAV